VASSGANLAPWLQQGTFVGASSFPYTQCQLPTVVVPAGTLGALTTPVGQPGVPTVILGGGNPVQGGSPIPYLYGLDAATGAINWKVQLVPAITDLTQYTFVWSPPAVYSYTVGTTVYWQAYVGLASLNDCPLVQGQVVEVTFTTNRAQLANTFDVVPANATTTCDGGSVWTAPLVQANPTDPSSPYVWVSTGNGSGTCGANTAQACQYSAPGALEEPYAQALLKLSGNLQTVLGCYQERTFTSDDDFGAGPTFFDANGGKTHLVGLLNKDGTFYVFNRDTFTVGSQPVAALSLAAGDPHTYGNGSIAPAAWDPMHQYLYVGVGVPSSNPTYNSCPLPPNPHPTMGALYVFDLSQVTLDPNEPFNLRTEICFNNQSNLTGSGDGPVLGPVVADQGDAANDPLAAVGEGQWLVLVDPLTFATAYY
jgi:hypothetical protein